MCLYVRHLCWREALGPPATRCSLIYWLLMLSVRPPSTVIFTASSPLRWWQFSNLAGFRYQNAFFSHHCRLTVFS